MSYGYIYVLANDSLPYVKVGKTTRSPEERAKELTTTGVPTPFKVAYKVYVEDCDSLERRVHQRLHKYRVRNNREFFEVDLTVAVSTIEELTDTNASGGEENHQDFDPLKYLQDIVESREASKSESKISNEYGFDRARTHFNEVMSYLTPLNGQLDSDGLEVHFKLSDVKEKLYAFNQDCKALLKIKVLGRVLELPEGLWVSYTLPSGRDNCLIYTHPTGPDPDYYCSTSEFPPEGAFILDDGSTYPATDIEDPRKVAKKIISSIDWAKERRAEARRANNYPLERLFERVRRAVVEDYAKGYIESLNDEYHSNAFHNIVKMLRKKGEIAPITASSWELLWVEFANKEHEFHKDIKKYIKGFGWSNKLLGSENEPGNEPGPEEVIIDGIVDKVEWGSTFVNLDNGLRGQILGASYNEHIGGRGRFRVSSSHGSMAHIKLTKWL